MKRSEIDQMGNRVEFNFPPKRIISLVPSQTELLHSLGLEDEVIGITKFCVYPQNWKREKRIVGGTKKLHLSVIDELQPDLIIGNKEENEREDILLLQEKYPVWMSNVTTLQDAYDMIYQVGNICERSDRATKIVELIQNTFSQLRKKEGSALYLIWMKPWMGVASDTFIHSILSEIGFVNALQSKSRYPELSESDLENLNPDYVFLSSEPYPFKQKHLDKVKTYFPKAKGILVDGEYFSWYGSRLMKAPEYFNSLDLS
ncbi:MAG: ABC transporter substrate-binding protein [Cyclobacteriaceae bacterium]|nr:ABC transporter substrate-binding protein [Cyclobacteriaceae bacterium]